MTDLSFIKYREHLDVYSHALSLGLSDQRYVEIVQHLDSLVTGVAGVGFAETPIIPLSTPLDRLVIAKVETAGVAGSHKARHLFGLLIRLTAGEEVGKPRPTELAIASCGNAALGAATLAQASGRTLRVFVPADADPTILDQLNTLEATVQVCHRSADTLGDPCYTALQDAIAAGAEPFTVQGPTCPHVIDGGRTLGLELADQLRSADRTPTDLYVQVGGGALATAASEGLARGGFRPRLHPVQTQNAHPFVAMWRTWKHLVESGAIPTDRKLEGTLLRLLISKHDDLMKPWPDTPASIASGILDDITYDWRPLLYHQITSEGWPVLASEEDLMRATSILRSQVSPPPDATGAAGFAGLLADPKGDAPGAEPAVVLVTGVDRSHA